VTNGFAELGLGSAVTDAARAAGWDEPTPLQHAAASVLRRGGNVVLNASAGAGVTGAYAMPLLDRIDGGDVARANPSMLVLVPTQERAAQIADALASLAGATGIAVRSVGSGWRVSGAHVVVTTPQRALEGVQTSELKLDTVAMLVITDLDRIFALDAAAAVETLVPLVPRDAQRVVSAGSLTPDVERFIEAHVRRALTVPPRPAAPPRVAESAETVGQIGYMVVDEAAKSETLARLLESVTESAVVRARTARRAESIAGELSRRGIIDGERDIHIVAFDAPASDAARVISADVPFSAEQLTAFHGGGGTVLVTPAEVDHLRRIAAAAQFALKHRRVREADSSGIDSFRRAIADALATEDIAAQLLVLEPLFEQHDPAEVAAALSALLRRRAPAPAATAAESASAGAPPAQQTGAGFTRLFISIGTRDNIRPGDLVGAITGEANIKGEQVGRIDIRDSFSVVEVASSVAERVIRALNGTTMRGRSLRVDFDRKEMGGAGRPARRSTGRGRGR